MSKDKWPVYTQFSKERVEEQYKFFFLSLFISFVGHNKRGTRTKQKYKEQNDWSKGYCAKQDNETHARRNPLTNNKT